MKWQFEDGELSSAKRLILIQSDVIVMVLSLSLLTYLSIVEYFDTVWWNKTKAV